MAIIEEEREEMQAIIASPESSPAAVRLAEVNMDALAHLKRFFLHAESYDLDDLRAARLTNDAALGVITRQLKVDDGQFKRHALDELGEMLRQIKAEKTASD